MLKIDGIEKFISGNFENATICGKNSNGKIVLDIKMEGIPDKFCEYDKRDSSLKEEDVDNKIELLNYLISNYLKYNFLNGVNYFVNDSKHNDKNIFELKGSRNLKIILDKEFFELLPNDFIDKIDKKRRNDILECIEDINFDVEFLKIHNLDCKNTNTSFCGGIPGYYFIYNVLALNTNDDNIIPDTEKEFINKVFKTFMNKEKIDLEYFYNLKIIIDSELLNKDSNDETNILKNISLKLGNKFYNCLEIKLNNKTNLNIYDLKTLLFFRSFLDEYLNEYKNEKNLKIKER